MPRISVAVTKDEHAVLSALPANIIGLLHKIGVQFVADDFISELENNNTEPKMFDLIYKIFGKEPPARGRKQVMAIPLGIYNQIKDIVIPYGDGSLLNMLVSLGFKSPIEPPPPPPSIYDINYTDDFSTINPLWTSTGQLQWAISGGTANHNSSGLVSAFYDVTTAYFSMFDLSKGMNVSIDVTDVLSTEPFVACGIIVGYKFAESGDPGALAAVLMGKDFSGNPAIVTFGSTVSGEFPTFTIYPRTNLGRVKLEYSDVEDKFKFYAKETGAPDFSLIGDTGTGSIVTTTEPALCALFGLTQGGDTAMVMDNFELHAKAL